MMGVREDHGVIPLVCEDLFTLISQVYFECVCERDGGELVEGFLMP